MAEGALHKPFVRLDQQREADRLGMLVFLATEVMLFSGLFAAAFFLRIAHPADYVAASREMHYWLGGLNTAVLLTSSMLVAVVVEAVRAGRPRLAAWLLAATIGLGLAFLAIKATEYAIEWRDGVVPLLSPAHLPPGPRTLFMTLYFFATGLHAIHVTIGLALLATMIRPFGSARRDRKATTVGNAALYWHFVDLVWIFLYPTLYLSR